MVTRSSSERCSPTPAIELPTSVRDAILSRTAELDADAWGLLHLLACAPEAIPDHLLASLDVGLVPLRALDRAGLIRRGTRGVAFRHDLCRLAIATTVPPGADAAIHQRMILAIESSAAADPAVLVHHSIGAGDRDRVLRYAVQAARSAARSGAHTQSAAFYRIALLQGTSVGPVQEAEILESMAEECYLIDQLEHAIVACQARRCDCANRPMTQEASVRITTRSPSTSGTTPIANWRIAM